MAERPPYSGRRDGEGRPRERSGQQSGLNPGQNPASLFRTYQGSLPIPSPRSAFRRYQPSSQGTVPHQPTPPPSYMVGGSSQGNSSSSELQIRTNLDTTSHQMPPFSSLVESSSSQQVYSGPVNQDPDPNLILDRQLNFARVFRSEYQPAVSRRQGMLIGRRADEVGDSSQGPVYQYPDTNSYMISHQMPPFSSLVESSSSQQVYSGPVNQDTDPNLILDHQMPPPSSPLNFARIFRSDYQTAVSRHQGMLIGRGADEVGDSSQGPVYQYPDTNSYMTSHQMPPFSSLVESSSSQQVYSGPVNQDPDPNLILHRQLNFARIFRSEYQPAVSRRQGMLIGRGADEVEGSSQGTSLLSQFQLQQYRQSYMGGSYSSSQLQIQPDQQPDTNSNMTSDHMPPSLTLTLEDEATRRDRREKRARALFEQNMKGWDYLKKRK